MTDPAIGDPAGPDGRPERSARDEDFVTEVRGIVSLAEGEFLERAYVFEPIERGDVRFTLALVTKRIALGRLEMVALGGRAGLDPVAAREFVSRARFPEAMLPSILEEFIDRCGIEGRQYRRIDLEPEDDPVVRLAAALEPATA